VRVRTLPGAIRCAFMAERQVAELIGLSSRALDAAFERFRSYATDEEEELPGGVLVVCRHGQTAFLDAFGDVSTDTIFRAASMTKITTSLAAMMLCDRGVLLLDDPIAKFIPEFGSMERVTNDSGDAVSCATQITVRHLMAHTAGLTYGFFDGTGACGVVDELVRRGRESGASRCSAVSPGGAEHLAGQPLAFEPGSALRYSASTAVLGRVVSVASGVPLDDFMHDEVFSPLGMVDTAYYVPAEKQHRVAAAYAKVSPADAAVGNFATFSAWKPSPTTELMPLSLGPIPSDKPPHIGADGGLFTTAADWAMFMGAAAAAA
jgi:CubicO group peptidase (beta-lactamase class C family)